MSGAHADDGRPVSYREDPGQAHADAHCDSAQDCGYCHCGERTLAEPDPCKRCGRNRHPGEYYDPVTHAHGDV